MYLPTFVVEATQDIVIAVSCLWNIVIIEEYNIVSQQVPLCYSAETKQAGKIASRKTEVPPLRA